MIGETIPDACRAPKDIAVSLRDWLSKSRRIAGAMTDYYVPGRRVSSTIDTSCLTVDTSCLFHDDGFVQCCLLDSNSDEFVANDSTALIANDVAFLYGWLSGSGFRGLAPDNRGYLIDE